MISKVNIASIKLSQLDPLSLIWMSKIARALKHSDGVIIKLQEPTILSSIITESKRTNNPEVKQLYEKLKSSLRSHINSNKFDADQLDLKHDNGRRHSRAPGILSKDVKSRFE